MTLLPLRYIWRKVRARVLRYLLPFPDLTKLLDLLRHVFAEAFVR